MKSCYWPNEIFEPCFGGCAEVSCDNPRNHLRPCYPYCEPGCICEEPYVRDDRTHQCVLPQDCSPTQMGIPVPTKRSDKLPLPKFAGKSPRVHSKRDDALMEFENEAPPTHSDDFKRPSEISRMGNYFNIVIAPPPIKALQPRKLLQSDAFRLSSKQNEMRKLLLLALLLYDIVALATRSSNYDYDDIDGNKRHSFIDDRRNWRKTLLKPEMEHKDWDDRRRHDFDNPRYLEESDVKMFSNLDRQRDLDLSTNYRGQRRYDDTDKTGIYKSGEIGHSSTYLEKDADGKNTITAMNCERQHEKYEACFAGCASITCDNPRDRLRPCYPFCEAGCICLHPYVRDDRTHKCVLPDDCTKGLKGIPDLADET
ncbi:LOW QUALITY PROTEIN: uncharacterized protein ACR2FA_000196 [Aphomia sociella]